MFNNSSGQIVMVYCLLYLQRVFRPAALTALRTFGGGICFKKKKKKVENSWLASSPILNGLIAAFVMCQIRIVPLFVFINVFANINTCVWLCVVVGACMLLQRLSVIPPQWGTGTQLLGFALIRCKSLITCSCIGVQGLNRKGSLECVINNRGSPIMPFNPQFSVLSMPF